MVRGDNNPRLFASTVSLDAWRTKFDGARCEADLHIDVAFAEKGPVWSEGAPVRFRLSLRQAEVHVVRDSARVLHINRTSILRPAAKPDKEHVVTERKIHLGGGIEAGVSSHSLSLSGKGKAETSMDITHKLERSGDAARFEMRHWVTARGYAFVIMPREKGGRLDGQPWAANKAIMRIRDKHGPRKRGEPPEVRVEIHCLREHMILEDIEFTSSTFPFWNSLTRNRQLAVEQYIKDELQRNGFPCGDLSQPFARIVLGDVTPVEEG